jgi:hypothetical protein
MEMNRRTNSPASSIKVAANGVINHFTSGRIPTGWECEAMTPAVYPAGVGGQNDAMQDCV